MVDLFLCLVDLVQQQRTSRGDQKRGSKARADHVICWTECSCFSSRVVMMEGGLDPSGEVSIARLAGASFELLCSAPEALPVSCTRLTYSRYPQLALFQLTLGTSCAL